MKLKTQLKKTEQQLLQFHTLQQDVKLFLNVKNTDLKQQDQKKQTRILSLVKDKQQKTSLRGFENT